MSTAGSSSRSLKRQQSAICFEFERDGEDRRVRIVEEADHDLTLRQEDPDGREFLDELPERDIPASGERYEDCGDDIPIRFCRDCGSTYTVGRTCRRPLCPRCWQAWAFRQATNAASKLEALRRYRASSGNHKAKHHHLTLSLPDRTRFDSEDALGRCFEMVKSVMQQVNVDTGLIVYYPYRIVEGHRGAVLGHESGEGDKTWKNIIGEDDWEEYVTFAPHFHVVALSNFVQGGAVTRYIEEKTGLVVERITKGADSSVSIYDMEDLCSVTAYALSHAGIGGTDERANPARRYFGEVANFVPTPGVEEDVEEVMRTVAPTVLGITMPEPPEHCEEEREIEATETVAVERETSGDSSPSSSSSSTDPELGEIASPDPDSAPAPGTSSGGGGGGGRSGSPPPEREIDRENVEVTRERECRGRLLPMRFARRYLRDREWCGEADATGLAMAYREWLTMDDGRRWPPPE